MMEQRVSALAHRTARALNARLKSPVATSLSAYSTKSSSDGKKLFAMASERAAGAKDSAATFLQPSFSEIREVRPKSNAPRKNVMNIQMLPQSLYDQVFGYGKGHRAIRAERTSEDVEKAKEELKRHGLWTEETDMSAPEVALKLPKLLGDNIEEHFWIIGEQQSEPYRRLMSEFVRNGIPKKPERWSYAKGWTKYVVGKEPKAVDFPDEEALVLDVEVCLQAGEGPTLAVAVSPDAWYGWVSPVLVEEANPVVSNNYSTDMLIPMEDPRRRGDESCRIVIGHNVSYDRARIREQYYLEGSGMRFMDTMSLHICIGGISKLQKSLIKTGAGEAEEDKDVWKGSSCLSSLKDVYSLYCNAEISKEEKDVFVEGSLGDVRARFQDVMNYCSSDVKATYEIFQVLFPVFLERFPHPVTLAGMLEMGTAFLPVNANWDRYTRAAQERYDDLESEMSFLLAKKCDNACRLMHGQRYRDDPWMWSEDWSTKDLKLTKKKVKESAPEEVAGGKKKEGEEEEEEEDEEAARLTKKFKHLFDLEKVLPLSKPLLPGYPNWYRKLCSKPDSPDWKPGPSSVTSSLLITPKLLNLTYDNYPLHFVSEHGWGILVADLRRDHKSSLLPYDKLREVTERNASGDATKAAKGRSVYDGTALWCNHKIDNCCYFFRLPHRDGGEKGVRQPLSKSFNSTTSASSLGSSDSVAEKALRISNVLSYWRNNRERITGQMIVWLGPGREKIGVIIPKIVVAGTLTRRAVEPTWLTASKITMERLGSELRAMVQAPPGYHFVGADVDSEELWIASLIGDSKACKTHGGTPLGWMTLRGNKSDGTDMHSVTAKAAGISRDHAKVINYARIYGAGVRFAQKLLQQFNPSMSAAEAKEKASKMYLLTKGSKRFRLRKEFREKFVADADADEELHDLASALNFAKRHRMPVDSVFGAKEWIGGTESTLFNELERIANSDHPETPFLKSRLSRSLEPRFAGDDLFSITRVNWVVQSGAVDFLHLMLVSMRWLTQGRVRFCLSFHDEVRYMVGSEFRYQAALALQMTNLLARSFCSHAMGLRDLPLSVAFFSSVEVDKVMRKEADDDCVTLSNPHGLEKGYGVGKGESLDIHDAIRKSGGDLSAFWQDSKLRLDHETTIPPRASDATERL